MAYSPGSSSSTASSLDDTFHLHQQRISKKADQENMASPIIFTLTSADHLFPQRTLTPPSSGLPIIIGRAADPDKQAKFKTSAPYQAAPDNAKFHCPVMSRTHAQLTWIDHRPYLQDTGSTHGTWYQPNRVFVADSKGRKIRAVSHAAWEKIPKSLPLQEGMSIRFGRAITNPSNGTRHTPLEVKVRFHRPSEPFKPGTYGLKDSHINSSDDSGDEDRSHKTDDDAVDGARLTTASKNQSPERLPGPPGSKSDLISVARNANPPDSSLTVGHAAPETVDRFLSSNSPCNSTRSSDKNPSPLLDRSLIKRPNVKLLTLAVQQPDACPKQLSSVASRVAKPTEEAANSQDKAANEEEPGELSDGLEEENGEFDLQCTYGAREAPSHIEEEHSDVDQQHSAVEQEHSAVDQEHSSAEEDDSNDEEEQSEIEEEDSGIADDSVELQAAQDGEAAPLASVHQERDVDPNGRQTRNQNEVSQPGAQEASEVSMENSQESVNDDSVSSSASSQEASPPKISSVVDSVQKKHVSKSFKDLSVVTTITSQTKFTESLNRLPESLAKTVQSPKFKRLHKSSGEQETAKNRSALTGNSNPSDARVAPVEVVDGPSPVQAKRKRPAEFDEEESGNLSAKAPVSSRKASKRAPGSVCQHCAHEVHPAKKPKLSSKLVSAAQSLAIFALGGVATVAGILAFENVIE
ncbi:hypothetical protein PTTG_02232 [Puccinia triticina 1-1 BBBD Race 1]|uniref:FHA domain-containing protein n=1 Tax=Puccinia triticina (isolate 1-1 / race 1 (BBBD)) TaxID=630390 RepID=A0A180GI75_PUCT1|nr:hypothetical protein PTTG_02232 [Puccinia triticina 1-1 BBBD Race 1]